MDKFFAREIRGIAIPGIIAAGTLFYVLWAFFLSITWTLLFEDSGLGYSVEDEASMIITLMVLAPVLAFVEELLSRLPLSLMCKWGAPRNAKAQVLFVISMGLLFGTWHSLESGSEIFAMCMQGVGGIMLGLVYLWTGGYNGKTVKPLVITTVIHTCMNWTLWTFDLLFLLMQ